MHVSHGIVLEQRTLRRVQDPQAVRVREPAADMVGCEDGRCRWSSVSCHGSTARPGEEVNKHGRISSSGTYGCAFRRPYQYFNAWTLIGCGAVGPAVAETSASPLPHLPPQHGRLRPLSGEGGREGATDSPSGRVLITIRYRLSSILSGMRCSQFDLIDKLVLFISEIIHRIQSGK